MESAKSLDVSPLFPLLHAELVSLLRGLRPEDWERPTACAAWRVRDVVAHLLDGYVRRLSLHRDGHLAAPDRPVEGYKDLVAYLNELNADWVRAMRRASPAVLVDLLEATGPSGDARLAALDPDGQATFSVAWAGEERSANWFDLGREYTERWHHQQQIRDAVGAPGLVAKEWLYPVFDVFVRALPHTFRNVEADEGARVTLVVEGDAGGAWSIAREGEGWRLYEGETAAAAARVVTDQDAAWRLFCGQLAEAGRVRVEGDERLGSAVFGARAMMV